MNDLETRLAEARERLSPFSSTKKYEGFDEAAAIAREVVTEIARKMDEKDARIRRMMNVIHRAIISGWIPDNYRSEVALAATTPQKENNDDGFAFNETRLAEAREPEQDAEIARLEAELKRLGNKYSVRGALAEPRRVTDAQREAIAYQIMHGAGRLTPRVDAIVAIFESAENLTHP